MNGYTVARAYLLSLIFGGVAFLSLLMSTGISPERDPMDWMIGAFGFALIFLMLGTVISPLVFWAIKIIRQKRWMRPLADAIASALFVALLLVVMPHFEVAATFGEWGQSIVILEGAGVGLFMGGCYWCLAGKPSSLNDAASDLP